MPGCIMVMCGLPASGKTTLVSQFVTSMSEEFSCHVVDYDKLMPPDTEKQLIHQGAKAQDISLWKKYREVIISCVDRLLDKMKVPQTVNQQDKKADTHQVVTQHTDTHHRDVHHTDTLICQSQAEASTLSEDSSQTGPEETLWPQFELNLGQEENRNGHNCQMVVVIDDNMYYRSMRYDYYQLARKYRLGFCEVYVDCPSDMAVARNRQRTLGRVEENVIVTMATKMEVPDGASYHWEKYSISITHDTKNGCCRMRGLVEAAILDPVQAVVEDVAGKEESRRRCSENVIHQTDQILRKLLATRMKTAKETQLSKADLRSLSTKLTEVKSIILTEMRSGLITFTMESQDSSKDEESELFQFVKNIFESKLALTS
ncbi:L-seryl-tRNA(Sec) kinase-like isoform X2 [Haliotis rubra]|uniref:L-seryl-tRNA(Sec) kinase-like isoform X2 n=1 Tax=Haliotis rubra TaxID=36100 RepID=UPI001EE5757B|nr:L-seryl-tRNA(Sec) kinase-like isoform X2 [Haliotis rubra]